MSIKRREIGIVVGAAWVCAVVSVAIAVGRWASEDGHLSPTVFILIVVPSVALIFIGGMRMVDWVEEWE